MASSTTTQTVKNTYLVNKRTGRRYVLDGDLEYDETPTDATLAQHFNEHMSLDQSDLPKKVDLRPWMTKVEDQATLKSCTANAMAGAYEYLYNKTTGKKIDVSRLFVYYNSRVKALPPRGGWLTDSGSVIVYAIQSMSEMGVCLEKMWDYDRWKVNLKPPQECYRAAQEHLITEALEVNLDMVELKTCLAQGFPIIVSINVFKSFDEAEKGGIVPMPRSNEKLREKHGRHAVLLAGYSDRSHAFIVRNSWGETWGDRGYCFMPYEYLVDKSLTNFAWAIKKLNVDSFDQAGWCNVDGTNYTHYHEDEESEEGATPSDEGEDEEEPGDIEEIDEDVEYIEYDENDTGDDENTYY